MPSVEQIDSCLPQTQCTKCSYPDCREYARAIKSGVADINQCPPGGDVSIKALAQLLNVNVKPLNTKFGHNKAKRVASITEKDCIGCMLCIKACPVDAIIGSNKLMHSVIESECTGCDLCLVPCPMDCIEMIKPSEISPTEPWPDYSLNSANHARLRHENRLARLSNQNNFSINTHKNNSSADRKKIIEQAILRARSKRK